MTELAKLNDDMRTIAEYTALLAAGAPDKDLVIQLKSLGMTGKATGSARISKSITLATLTQPGYMLTCTVKKATLEMRITGTAGPAGSGPPVRWQEEWELLVQYFLKQADRIPAGK